MGALDKVPLSISVSRPIERAAHLIGMARFSATHFLGTRKIVDTKFSPFP